MTGNQQRSLEVSAAKLYAEITEFAHGAIREHFTLDAFYHATQLFTTPEGSEIEKVGSVLTVDRGITNLFLERGFTPQELTSPLLYVGVYWQSMVGRDRRFHGRDPLEIRRTYVSLSSNGLRVVEREKEGAWTQPPLREEDVVFLKKMHAASTLPFLIVETYTSHQAFTQAVWRAIGEYPVQAGVDFTTPEGNILFDGGLSHFTRIIEKARAGDALSSSSEIQTSRIVLERQQGHFQTLFQLIEGQPLYLRHIDDPFNLLPAPKQEREPVTGADERNRHGHAT